MRDSPVFLFPKLKPPSSFIAESNRFVTLFKKQNSELTTLLFHCPLFMQARKGEKISTTHGSTSLYLHHKPISWAALYYNVKINWAEVGSCYYRLGCSE